MQASQTVESPARASLGRSLSWFLMPPLLTAVLVVILLAVTLVGYQATHASRVYEGVTVWGVDLSGLTEDEAETALQAAYPYADETAIVLIEPGTGRQWTRTPAAMGLRIDWINTLAAALAVGRTGDPATQLWEQFESWYYGRYVAPVVIFDEGQLDDAIAAIAAEIDRPAVDATIDFDGRRVEFVPAQIGRRLDRADLRARLLAPIGNLQRVEVELLVHELPPRNVDTTGAANQIRQIIGSPMTLYFDVPLQDLDLDRITITAEELTNWVRIELVAGTDGHLRHHIFLDEVALRNRLADVAELVAREPLNARFYFDDNTRQLVLVEPHINGRRLDIDATVAQFQRQVVTSNRSLPFALEEILPVAHSNVTAEELGITELVSESTTWFSGSPDARRHNIALAASNFYGVLVAPGEQFSFNKYLGEVSEEVGYEIGLIISGGRTVDGVGGGVCQVSTTLFQSVFWAGLPINERWEHGYQVSYYNDGEGPGMDATVFSPIVDFRFTNNTPNYLLIENYYNSQFESLTFKLYGTKIGRVVEKIGPFFDNVRPPRPDIWEYNEELEPGAIRQVDWAVEGADVTVSRRVFNYLGDILIDEVHVSQYIPWQNIYEYGPGIDPNNLPADWRSRLEDDS